MTGILNWGPMTSVFNQPRLYYTERLRESITTDAGQVLALLRDYRRHHSDYLLSNTVNYSVDQIIARFCDLINAAESATVLSDIRLLNARLSALKKTYNEPLHSVFFSLALLHGLED